MKPAERIFRVFVVEDEPLIAMIVEDALLASGCEMVGPFAQLGEALEAAHRGDFDCAILDLNIRGGFSYSVAILLAERGCPILLATGYRTGSLPASLAQVAQLAKPYSSEQLKQEIRKLCDRVC